MLFQSQLIGFATWYYIVNQGKIENKQKGNLFSRKMKAEQNKKEGEKEME